MHRSTLRRRVVPTSVALTSALVLTACSSGDDPSGSSGADESQTLVVSTFPFGVEEFQEAVVDPFEEATDITVEIETGSNADRLSRLELNQDRSGIDVMLMSDYYAAMGQASDLFEEVDADLVPNLDHVADFAKEAQFAGPAYSFQLNGTLYRTDELDAAQAASWDLYGDPELEGRTALPDISATAGQLTVSGVGATFGSGPYDIDTALGTMASWAPGTLQFYTSSTEVTNLLTQREIFAAPTLSGFATDLVASGEPIAWTAPDTGRYMATNRVMIPAGAPNSEAAHQFIDYLLSAEAQTASAEVVGDLPVNQAATIPSTITDVTGDAATDPIGEGYETLDIDVIVDNRSEWVDRFTREVSSR